MKIEIIISDDVIIKAIQGVIDLFLKPKFTSLGMNATGRWLQTLEARANNGVGEIWGQDYTYFLANGRKPGKAPPISALLPWVTAKFGVGSNEAKGIAFAVAQKIKKKGTNYYPDGTDLLEVLSSKEVANYIYGELQEGVSVEINKILIKQLNDNFT